jgi:monoamine oxidase
MAAEQSGNTNATRSGSADVIVVGAGLAGLSAARALAAGGAAPIVLEARDRVGGKTDSRRVGNAVFDLGAQWLGPGQERCYGLVREFGLTLFPTHCRGTKILDINGRRSTYTGAIPSVSPLQLLQLQLAMSVIDRAAKQVPLAAPWTAPRAAKWDAMTIEAWRKRLVWSRDAATVLEIALRTPFGAEASEMSMLHLLTIVNGSGGFAHMTSIEHGSQQDRIVESAHRLAMGLAAPLGERVVLNEAVRRIQQDADGITVYTDSQSWRAQYAIVALAPMLAGRIEYEPGLPPMRDSLTQRVPMGATIKCIALYERAFWREQGFSGEAVGDFGAIGVALDNSSHDGAQPALVGFIGGRAARAGRIHRRPRRPRVERAARGRTAPCRAARLSAFLRLASRTAHRLHREGLASRSLERRRSGWDHAAGRADAVWSRAARARRAPALGWNRNRDRMARLHGGCNRVRRTHRAGDAGAVVSRGDAHGR